MRYMLLMYSNPAQTIAMTASDRDAVARKHEALRTELTGSGELLNGAGLAYPESTKTSRLRAGVPATTDGPVMESEAHMTAYYVIDCERLEGALAIAQRTLDFHVTAVEVREIHVSVGMG